MIMVLDTSFSCVDSHGTIVCILLNKLDMSAGLSSLSSIFGIRPSGQLLYIDIETSLKDITVLVPTCNASLMLCDVDGPTHHCGSGIVHVLNELSVT